MRPMISIESKVSRIVLLLLVLQDSCCLSVTRRFVVSSQRSDRCPDLSSSFGDRRDARARSNIECARICTCSIDCLHYTFNRNSGLCTLFTTTPTRTLYEEGCILMLDPMIFDGCLNRVSVLVDPDGCSLPFQRGNQEFYGCMETNFTAQCAASSGQLIDCIVPLGFKVRQDVTNLTVSDTSSPFPLPCISNWIILMQRFSNSVYFFRNWTDYKDGFGDFGGGDFWTGNEDMHRLTNTPGTEYRLRVEVQTYSAQKWYYAEYATFSLDPEVKGYTIHLSGYSGNAGNSLSNTVTFPQWNHNGMNFTTPDSDNDRKLSGNCALQYGGGWWFNDCYFSCLTCPFATVGFSWYTLTSNGPEPNGQLLAARMMFRSN